MSATRKLYEKIKNTHIPISVICKETGLSVKAIYPSLKENGKRQLRADELLVICKFLKINPMELLGERRSI